jgi:hypothetical protein
MMKLTGGQAADLAQVEIAEVAKVRSSHRSFLAVADGIVASPVQDGKSKSVVSAARSAGKGACRACLDESDSA